MLLKLFRSQHPLLIVLIVLLAGTFYFPAFQSGWAYPKSDNSLVMPYLYELFVFSPLLGLFVNFTFIIISALYFNKICNSLMLLPERATLPGLFFILFSGALIPIGMHLQVGASTFFLLLSVEKVVQSYRQSGTSYHFFAASFFIGIGSLLVKEMIFLLPVLWIGINLFRPFNWREWLFTFLGPFSVYYMVASAYYMVGAVPLDILIPVKQFSFILQPWNPGVYRFVLLGVIALCMLLSIRIVFSVLPGEKIVTRKTSILWFWYLFVGFLVLFFIPDSRPQFIGIVSLPVSFFLAEFFLSVRKNRFFEFMFFIFFLSALLAIFME